MKYLLYVTVAVLLSSVECTVIRQTANSIDKPSSNHVVHCPSGCGSSTVKPDPVDGLETSVSHVPPSPSENEVVSQDTEQNQQGGQSGQQLPEVSHQELKQDIGTLFPIGGELVNNVVNKAKDLTGAFVPKVGKRDIGSLFPIGGEFVSDVVNKGEDFVGTFVPKLENQDIGSLLPIGGEYVSDVVNKWEDLVKSLIPKVGKRHLRSRRRVGSNGHRIGERFGTILLTPFV